MSFLKSPEVPKPPKAPNPVTNADASVQEAGADARLMPNSSYISTGSISGLKRKANTQKPSLIGGGM